MVNVVVFIHRRSKKFALTTCDTKKWSVNVPYSSRAAFKRPQLQHENLRSSISQCASGFMYIVEMRVLFLYPPSAREMTVELDNLRSFVPRALVCLVSRDLFLQIIAAVCLVRLKSDVNLPARAEWDETFLQFRH